MKLTAMKVFQEVALRHMTPEQGADILIRQDCEASWVFRFKKYLGLVPYRQADTQCERCLLWRLPYEVAKNRLSWTTWNGKTLCPDCVLSTLDSEEDSQK